MDSNEGISAGAQMRSTIWGAAQAQLCTQRQSSVKAASRHLPGPPCGTQIRDSFDTLLEPSSETLLGNIDFS